MDWQLTCRVCLETGDMVSLFDWDENNEQLGDKYTYCCGIEVSKNDSFPTLICLNCVDRLTYAYQFKQQCLSSNDTLKECLEEFERTSKSVASAPSTSNTIETETITIKQENGLLLQYELPVEHDSSMHWSRAQNNAAAAVVTKSPGARKRGRPRKYPNEQGQIELSPYQRKKPRVVKEHESLTSLLESGALDLKQEPGEDDEAFDGGDDPDFSPDGDGDGGAGDPSDHEFISPEIKTPKKRGRPRKHPVEKPAKKEDNGEDVLLKETILAFSEPIPEHVLNPKPKKKYKTIRKKYVYEKTHICETCGASFTSNASLQTHIRRHLGIKPFVCSVCGYACVQNIELRRHMMRHTGQRPYKCRICERRFGDFGSRQKHESHCGFRCANRSNFGRHMIRHSGVKPLKCNHCDRRFFEHSDKNKHESVCGFACVMNEALKRHMLRHTGEKPYKCRICDRRFGDFGTRQKHERLHMGLRPYQCSLCGKAFTYSYVLSNHMLTHTGEKKFSCTPCNKKFTKAHHLKYHNKVHHKDLYIQQQIEAEAKKLRQSMKMTGLSAAVLTGKIVDGALQLVPAGDGEAEADDAMVMEEEGDDPETKETQTAVAGMQAVVLDADFTIGGDMK